MHSIWVFTLFPIFHLILVYCRNWEKGGFSGSGEPIVNFGFKTLSSSFRAFR